MLLCSDGLSNMVPDEDIRQVIRTSETLEETGRRLVSMANDNGGRDNIAVVLVEPETKRGGSMLNVGVIVGERYEIAGRVGSGGMADVYKAKDHKLNRLWP